MICIKAGLLASSARKGYNFLNFRCLFSLFLLSSAKACLSAETSTKINVGSVVKKVHNI